MRMPRPGVRGFTTLAATGAVAVVLAAAGFALTVLLRRELMAGVDTSLRNLAVEVSALVDANALTPAVPAAQDEVSLVQVLDATGRVVAASANIEGEAALTRPASLPRLVTTAALPIGGGDRYRLLAQPAGPAGERRTVVVARSLGPTDRAVASASRLLLLVMPVVLALTAMVTWLGVGRALAPVERIRRKVATIGAGDLSQRVPLPRAHDEVHRLAQTMNSMLGRLHASTGRQRHFVADASHELRSPLANMQALLEVALARRDLELWQETGRDLQVEYGRMQRLVEDLLLLARLDGQVPMRAARVDLDEIVHEAAQRLRRLSELRVNVEPLPALQVIGDGAQLARVVRNLGDNAVRHGRQVVSLSLRKEGLWALIRVANDGPEVPPEHRERIFDRFTRLDQARARDRGGSGLGLSISREIAEAHGGSLVLLPGGGMEGAGMGAGGAVFELRLPIASDTSARPAS